MEIKALSSEAQTSSKSSSRLIPVYAPYMFLIPAMVLLIAFRYIPAVSAIYYSFTDWNGVSPARIVGLQQYNALFQDPAFVRSVTNILIYTAARTLLATVMALVGAE